MTRLPFLDREDAGHWLAQALAAHRGQRPLVLAIPRGAVPMGRIIADALDGELDVVLVRKIGAPHNPELALGAIDELGSVHMSSTTPSSSKSPCSAAAWWSMMKNRPRMRFLALALVLLQVSICTAGGMGVVALVER